MGLGTLNKTISLLTRLIDDKTTTEPILEFSPQKPSLPKAPVSSPLPRTSPESVGISSAYIAEFLTALELDKSLNMHTVTILRHGKVICEAGFGAYNTQYFSSTFSECKSITSLAIGILIGDGKLRLDEKVIDMFPDDDSAMAKLKYKNLTVEDLLTMRSGATFAEAGSMADSSWIKAFFSSSVKGDIGETFNYNSLNTYILSAIVKQKSGKNLLDFLRERLFDEMDIQGIFWEKSPEGIEKGGWGLYIRPEDMAKIGLLVMQGGKWNGKQLVPAGYIRLATAKHSTAPKSCGDFNYGYQIWCGREHNVFLFNGMFGQNTMCFPDNDIIIVSTAGNNEFFQQSSYYRYAIKYFCRSFPEAVPVSRHDAKLLGNVITRLSGQERITLSMHRKQSIMQKRMKALDGITFLPDEPRSASLGLLPMLLQATQNNYTKGTKKISIDFEEEVPYMLYEEADSSFKVPLGIGKPLFTELDFHGEPYKVASRAVLTKNEDDEQVLKVIMDFLETPFTRIMKFIFRGDGSISLLAPERPGADYVFDFVGETLSEMEQRNKLIASAVGKIDPNYLRYKVNNVFSPSVKFKIKR